MFIKVAPSFPINLFPKKTLTYMYASYERICVEVGFPTFKLPAVTKNLL